MRLIDADTLRAARYHALPYTHIHALGVDVESYERGWNDALDAAAESAPTVEAEPVKHGHWTDRAKSILGVPTEACSECAEWSVGYKKDYCPNCGAKMDEVTDGNNAGL